MAHSVGQADSVELTDWVLSVAFGEAWPAMSKFHDLLAEDGERLGLIGPREVPRLWQRHIVNCAAVASVVPRDGSVIDLGSGAGLPGIVLAAMRRDCSFELIDAMSRRTDWLQRCAAELGLTNVNVTWARAQDVAGRRAVSVVTARAVAPLAKLVGWSLPLLASDGILVAIKGVRAGAEIEAAAASLRRLGVVAELQTMSLLPEIEETRVVIVRRRGSGQELSSGSSGVS